MTYPTPGETGEKQVGTVHGSLFFLESGQGPPFPRRAMHRHLVTARGRERERRDELDGATARAHG